MKPTSATNALPGLSPTPRTTYTVLLLCFLAIVSEGYDVGVMGVIVPALLHDSQWHLTPVQIGEMGSAALFGTLFGSYFIGFLSDMLGRKPLMIGCVALFSLSMIGAAWAPSPLAFSIARFIGGLGLGGVISAAAALTVEYSPVARRNLNFALMYSGYSLGALLSALIGMAYLPSHGWRFVVALGAAPLLLVPVLMIYLPESLQLLVERGKTREAGTLAARLGLRDFDANALRVVRGPSEGWLASVRAIFSRGQASTTFCLWLAQIAAVMVIYGLGTWLPQIMRKLGYELGPSLSFLAVFMLSSAVGGVVMGRVSDRLGARRTIAGGYVIGALAIALLTVPGGGLLRNYTLVALAGLGSVGVAMVQLGHIATYYAASIRASATGWAVGVGRFGAMAGPIIGGYLAAQSVDVKWNFYVFACASLVAGIAIISTPRTSVTVADAVGKDAQLDTPAH
ncbi:MFS transporter [Chitinasiproducens palmae]|uniref:MFS transporter, AAHS family, benzoate transport protein n=1 Tax=Chitinasiproducens palmae TaxID=1770053 RepID=A0A1H2PLC0_9BURK|nr:MFS transporter [Chitinasiproducens palmae]SDV47280.1 MFS transporter, AAHS family, benzoate transport protein [Chitinasiproducens palmae]